MRLGRSESEPRLSVCCNDRPDGPRLVIGFVIGLVEMDTAVDIALFDAALVAAAAAARNGSACDGGAAAAEDDERGGGRYRAVRLSGFVPRAAGETAVPRRVSETQS